MISKSNCYTFVIFFFVLITFLINKFENLITTNYELLYQLWFRTISSFTNLFSFSVGDLVYLTYPIAFIYFFRKRKLRRKKLLTIFYFIAIPYIFFYWSWGFNYSRATPELIKYTDNELIEVTEYYLNEVNNLQHSITNNKNEPVKVEDKFSELRKKTVNSLIVTTKQFEIKNLTNHPIKISLF